MFQKTLLPFLICCFTACSLSAGEADAFFEKGNAAFESGDYRAAVQQYEAALQAGFQSPELYVNLGHAFFRQRQWAKAILNYERARLLQPDDARIRADLALARKKADPDGEQADNRIFLVRWWHALLDLASPDAWAGACLLLMWLAGAGFWFAWKGQPPQARRWSRLAATILLPLALMALLLAGQSAERGVQGGGGIVMSKKAPVFPVPDPNTEPLDSLPEGSKVQLPDRIGDWWKVELPGGEEGWMPRETLEPIRQNISLPGG